ncbi:hypothetical protein RHMOL_Rhmol03G0088800 [Rhododendron molle]|uniref:Uncharacterized protein n=1 Tax=Rhododendron molle TaxID=49168 RepID=A0ACC0PCI0_RHOML|nr:hypothetical protein RHMOL_Rhmol03G0088800 [Rhododendron molle]
MGSNSRGPEQELKLQHTIQISEAKQDLLKSMHQRISATPQLLSKSSGHSNCSIYRAPKTLIEVNGKAYKPDIVSVGPFHHGEPGLQMIQEHKWRFLGDLLNRTRSKGLSLEDYLRAVEPLETEARGCYSEAIRFTTDEFLEMLVLDGCFIVELFRKIGKVVPIEHDDPLISMWVYSFILRDFIKLENQIPFFILQRLFDLSLMPEEESGPSLAKLALIFFNNALQRPEEVITKHASTPGRHLLDFLRSSFIPTDHEGTKQGNSSQNHVIQCISKLRRAGIDLKPGDEDSFLVVKFRHGVIEMPSVSIDTFMSCFIINCIAFEQCQAKCTRHFTTYATLLDCLVNTGKDVEFLSDRNIVENYLGTDAELAKFINDLGKDVTFDIENSYLGKGFRNTIYKLSLAASVYFLWGERNARIFQGRSRSVTEVTNEIFYAIRAKLSSWSTVTFQAQNRGLCEDWLLDSRIFGINNCR